MGNILSRAFASFWGDTPPSRRVVAIDNGRVTVTETHTLYNERFRLTIIAEENVDDLQEALDEAIKQDNYELATVIRGMMNKKNTLDDVDPLEINEE